MPRYIDVDALAQQVCVKLCTASNCSNVLKIIHDMPTADVVEVVRCKDCKYCEHWYADKGRCFLWHESGIDVFEDGFCNYGERREDDEGRSD